MKYITLLLIAFSLTGKSQPGSPKPEAIIQQLKSEEDGKQRIALIHQIATFSENDLSTSELEYVTGKLIEWYKSDPRTDVHSAIDLLFRHSGTREAPKKVRWNMSQALEEIDRELVGKRSDGNQWFVVSQLHTMSVIRGPVTFAMGSPVGEKYRSEDEQQHQTTIPRSFAISTKEVTVLQFQKFLEENSSIRQAAAEDAEKNPSSQNKRLLLYSPDDRCPQVFVTWYEAAQYCNWLSKCDGIPESEWCYIFNEPEGGMTIPKSHLKRKGYRLPTEAEWEYAARAGTTTSRFYGESDEQLSEYAWYSKNPPQRKNDPNDPNDPKHTYAVGQLKPNMFGLFDVYGNVWEWCDSRRAPYSEGHSIDDSPRDVLITDSVAMVRRGGSFSYGKDVMRSAHRGATNYFPNQRRDNVGFRIAKTID